MQRVESNPLSSRQVQELNEMEYALDNVQRLGRPGIITTPAEKTSLVEYKKSAFILYYSITRNVLMESKPLEIEVDEEGKKIANLALKARGLEQSVDIFSLAIADSEYQISLNAINKLQNQKK